EFVVILPGCPITEALPVLERVRQRLAEQVTSGRVPSFTVSFGLASSDQAPDFDAVVGLADEALLQAKGAGRDQGSNDPLGPTTPLGQRGRRTSCQAQARHPSDRDGRAAQVGGLNNAT